MVVPSGEEFLILAPRGRDASVIAQSLERISAKTTVCPDLLALRSVLDREVSGVIVTEESLDGPGAEEVLQWIEDQPPWSDLPFVVLATRQVGIRSRKSSELLHRLGNVILLERPLNVETLSSAALSAKRARQRQYQAQSLLAEQSRSTALLRTLNETLEQRVIERATELSAARETLAFALDSAGMGTWDLDLASQSVRRTLRHDQIFGYKDMLPAWGMRQFLDYVVAEDVQAFEGAFKKAIDEGILELECRIKRVDGEMRWIAAKGRVEYDEGRRPLRMAGILMDVTERKRTEDALHQAQKMEAIGQLTGGVAHDFNNLLTVIVGGLDMVIRRPEQTERVIRLAKAAMTAARRGEHLTQQLLAYSRRQMLRPETLNPNRLLLDFKSLAERAAGEAITIVFDLDAGVHPIRVDPTQLESAILNLIVNSRDAMPNGGEITVQSKNTHRATEVAMARGIAPGGYVMLSVTDNGSGISEGALLRAFEPFFTTKEVGKGSGLGLAQVYGFARSAGGDVTIESELGKGTTVRLFFPRSAEQPSDIQEPRSSHLPLRRATTGETVLLVEDDEQVLLMAVESLEELHYRVIVSRNAREALEHLQGPERIDIMFSDVVMPGGMNGAQLAVEARRLRPELRVLLTSGYVGETGAEELVDDTLPVLNKPYRRDELAEKLRIVLGSRV